MGTPLYTIREKAKLALFDIKDILDSMNIEFVLLQGTLLGAIREKDFIATDEDIDLGTRIYDLVPRIKELEMRLCDKGFRIKLVNQVYGFAKDIKIVRSPIRTDLVSFDFYKDKMFRTLKRPDRINVKVYNKKFIDNLKEIDFLGKKFKVFSDAEEWVEIEYGTNWKKKENRSGKFTTAFIENYWEDVILKNRCSNYGKTIECVLKYQEAI